MNKKAYSSATMTAGSTLRNYTYRELNRKSKSTPKGNVLSAAFLFIDNPIGDYPQA
jgi:hypothetical protein